MSNGFITNSTTDNLKKRLVELVSQSTELKFLIGFFYFSGIDAFYNTLKENKNFILKILVGLETDKIIYELTQKEQGNRLIEEIVKKINAKNYDTEEACERIEFYLDLIRQDRLIIRQTASPNHAKLYIFHLNDTQVVKDIFITGSSNFTQSGLETQNEFNVELKDGTAPQEARAYFDELWETATLITEYSDIKQKMLKKIKEETLIAEITPYQAFVYVLKTYLDSLRVTKTKSSIKELLVKKGYTPYRYQTDAIAQAESIINNPDAPNGVIISDVVGLGKSIIASLVAKSLGTRGIIICPPGLMGDANNQSGWSKYREDFELFGWEIRSLGIDGPKGLEKTLELVRNNYEYKTIIVDEVHRFRNQGTRAYELLSNICRGKQVIALTATPFNNNPADIFSLLKLFITPGKSSISLDDDITYKFKRYGKVFDDIAYIHKYHHSMDEEKRSKALTKYKSLIGDDVIDINQTKNRAKVLAREIRQVIEPVVIRRNRLDLKKDPTYSQEVYNLSEVTDPQEIYYKLSPAQSQFYDEIITSYFSDESHRFKGAMYQPYIYKYGNKQGITGGIEGLVAHQELQMQKNLYSFIRKMIIKRFESSFASFEKTIDRILDIHIKVRNFVRTTEKYILKRSIIDKIEADDEEEMNAQLIAYAEELNIGKHSPKDQIYDLNQDFLHKTEFLADLDSDILMLREIVSKLKELELLAHDPKLQAIKAHVSSILTTKPKAGEPQRKIIIFSEYADTINYLKDNFGDVTGSALTIAGQLDGKKVETLLSNFDATHRYPVDDYQVVLATDKISEGFNLSRAGAIINYDIPWNPTRIIQRLGRINRIGNKVFDELHLYNCFPTEQGASEYKVREIAYEKMFLIHNTLGEDSKILDITEEPTPAGLFNKLMQNPGDGEEISFLTRLRILYDEIKEKHPETIEKASNLPPRLKVAKKGESEALDLFIKKGIGLYIKSKIGESITEPSFEDAFERIVCDYSEPRLPISSHLWVDYKEVLEKNLSDKRGATTTISPEVKAKNIINTLLEKEELDSHRSFLYSLHLDLTNYKTLTEYTIRRIAELDFNNLGQLKLELKQIKHELGEDFGSNVKNSDLDPVTIVAIENQL